MIKEKVIFLDLTTFSGEREREREREGGREGGSEGVREGNGWLDLRLSTC